jgi:hypothetical protein
MAWTNWIPPEREVALLSQGVQYLSFIKYFHERPEHETG